MKHVKVFFFINGPEYFHIYDEVIGFTYTRYKNIGKTKTRKDDYSLWIKIIRSFIVIYKINTIPSLREYLVRANICIYNEDKTLEQEYIASQIWILELSRWN